MQDNKDKEISTDEVHTEYKGIKKRILPGGGGDFYLLCM